MRYVEIQNTRMPALGFGTYGLRGDEGYAAVQDALEVGYRHLDTAQRYDNELAVGRAVEGSGIDRGEVFLTTKVWWQDLSFEDCLSSAQESLDKLRTDYVDLLLIHWPNEELPLQDPLNAMLELRDGGRVRQIGGSNFTPTLLGKAIERAPVFCNQVEYHPFLGQPELLELARQHDMMLTAYCPLARGKVLEDETLRSIGRAHGKSAAQVTLRWLLQQRQVAAIPRSASPEHRRENFDLFDFALSPADMERISALANSRTERIIDPSFAPSWER